MDKIIAIIAAVSRNGVYAENSDIPWKGRILEDMKRFRIYTTGHTVVMGRKTWESLPEKYRPLPDRHNIVVSSDKELNLKGTIVVSSLWKAIERAITKKVIFIGGADVWRKTLPLASEVSLTTLDTDYPIKEGTLVFPEFASVPSVRLEECQNWKTLFLCKTEVKCGLILGDLDTNVRFEMFSRKQ